MTAPIKILFVDDEQLILSALRRSLRREGFELYFTADPSAAARLVGEHQIDIVVSDYMMPEQSGVEVLALIGRLHQHTVRIMMTGQADREATIRAINEGNIHRFIEKPWDDAELKRILHEVARSIQVRRQSEPRSADQRPHRTLVRDGTGAIVIKTAALDRA
ncbi:MAG: response regulator [Deltaproteobacteria bacterium]|nr:response regulator [Deltaproteobacteria bacterium]